MNQEPADNTWSFGSFVCLRRFPQSLLRESQLVTELQAADPTNLVAPAVAHPNEALPLADLPSGLRIERPAA